MPASILMLAAGGFAAAGDLSLTGSAVAAFVGAVSGDQLGYVVGRRGGARLIDHLIARGAPLTRAMDLLARRGGIAVFLSRWLLSPLGPYVNVAAGAARQPWGRFAFWDAAGEGVWVGLYVGLGYVFTGNLDAAMSAASGLLGFLAAGGLALGLAYWLVTVLRAERRKGVTPRGSNRAE
jgi:membrane protein DedA with SNARE-associated domain